MLINFKYKNATLANHKLLNYETIVFLNFQLFIYAAFSHI